jgi:glyoxylase-like metal-dependent hydrolase (beta-lactamase superfamily II)/predicted ester cyclase
MESTLTAEAVARRYFDAVTARDVDAMAACWAPGGVDRLHGLADLDVPAGLKAFFGELFGAMPDFTFEVLSTTAEEDRCAVQWRATGTFAGPGTFQGLEPTGMRVDLQGCDVVRVDGDRVVANDAYMNGMQLAQQLGAVPPAGSGLETRMKALTNRRTKLTSKLASAPLETIADGVHVLRGGLARTMNVYLVEHEGRVTVFDAGEKGMAHAILAAAAPLGGIDRVVLGHADNDHRGAAPGLHAPVFCHPLEVTAAEAGGHRDYWKTDRLPRGVRALHGFSMKHVWEGGPVPIAGTVTEGDEVAGFRVVELPGHAPGLIGLWRESDGVALVSDAFYMTNMYGRPQPAAVPIDPYNWDTERARASLRKLADLGPRLAAPGHLGPLTGDDVPGELRRAAER